MTLEDYVERSGMSSQHMYRAIPCNCGYPKCSHWHVSGVADVHGVRFTKQQAEAVSALLNQMEALTTEGRSSD